MSKILVAPSKYVQGAGELRKLENYTNQYGKNILALVFEGGDELFGDRIRESFKDSDSKVIYENFKGECSTKEINRLRKIFKDNNIDVVMGIGGGKTLDTAKAISYYEGVPVVIVPTTASTDAPCSAISVVYTEEGVVSEVLKLRQNPECVVLDTEVIATSPVRLTVAGMGDALATYFEARAVSNSNASNSKGGRPTKAALTMAKLCYETLLEDGYKAKVSQENGVVTRALENIIEANTLLSGVGFESAGLAAAHAIHNGFTVLADCHHMFHGEKVAFGTIAQLVLENADMSEIREVITFCKSVSLPTTLSDMGIKEVKEDDIMAVAERACIERENIHNMPFKVTPEDVFGAIMAADHLGREIG